MLAVDGAVGSCDGGLDVAQRGVDPFERRRACRLRSRPGRDNLMRAPGIGDAGETLKAVADDSAVRIEAALGEPCNRSCTEAGDPGNFSRTGFPSAVVSTAATNGVLPGAPRPRFPPWRSPPR